MMYKESIAGVIFCFFLWLLMFFVAKRQSRRVYRQNNTSIYRLLFVVTVLYSTFAFTSGDYYSYHELYDEIVKTNSQVHIEPFYYWLLQILPDNYHLWRFAVWGLSTILLIALFRKLKLNPQFTSLLFVLMLLVYYAAPRNSLGYCALYLGVAYLLFPAKKKTRSKIVGIAIIVCSLFLHKSMFLYLGIVMLSLIPFNKYMILGSVLFFPFFYKSVVYISLLVLQSDIASVQSSETGINYIESEDEGIASNIRGIVRILITKLPVYVMLIYSIWQIYFKRKKIQVQYVFKVFLQCSFILIYMSLLFKGQPVSRFLSPRFWDASIYTLVPFFAYFIYPIKNKTFVKWCIFFLFISNMLGILLPVYLRYK